MLMLPLPFSRRRISLCRLPTHGAFWLGLTVSLTRLLSLSYPAPPSNAVAIEALKIPQPAPQSPCCDLASEGLCFSYFCKFSEYPCASYHYGTALPFCLTKAKVGRQPESGFVGVPVTASGSVWLLGRMIVVPIQVKSDYSSDRHSRLHDALTVGL